MKKETKQDLKVLKKLLKRLNRDSDSEREYVVGFGPTKVKAGATYNAQAQVQMPYRGNRLIIASALSNNFSVNDIRVGKDSQAISANPIPAAAFSELAVGIDLGLDIAIPGHFLTLSVTNTTDKEQVFAAALIGKGLQEDYLQIFNEVLKLSRSRNLKKLGKKALKSLRHFGNVY
jgi:hypothetical protein